MLRRTGKRCCESAQLPITPAPVSASAPRAQRPAGRRRWSPSTSGLTPPASGREPTNLTLRFAMIAQHGHLYKYSRMVRNNALSSSSTTRANKVPISWPGPILRSSRPWPAPVRALAPALPLSPLLGILSWSARHMTSIPRRRHALSAGAFASSDPKRFAMFELAPIRSSARLPSLLVTVSSAPHRSRTSAGRPLPRDTYN